MAVEKDNILRLQFDVHTIEHLGVQMYKTLPPVLAELISNSYDADASCATVIFDDKSEQKSIIVIDDGCGMSFDELNDYFLKIGRNRRKQSDAPTPKGRKVTGRKGLGKLAIFGIANEIEVQTVKHNLKNVFIMNLQDILATDKEYNPQIIIHNEAVQEQSGTKIILREIQRKSEFNIEELKEAIAKRFNFTDTSFSIQLQKEGCETQIITTETKWDYITSQFQWEFPQDDTSENSYAAEKGITGKIISTEKPLNKHQNGIFLYARGKLVNSNDFFGLKTTTSFAYNYFTGFINVDFIDDYDKDMVTTNRDGLTWENEELDSLRNWLQNQLFNIAKEWRIKREELKKEEVSRTTGINLTAWVNTMPQKLQDDVNSLVDKIVKDEEIDETRTKNILNELKNIVPEYPYFHWRNLHPKIREVAAEYYMCGNYYHAFIEAAKNYKNAVRDKSAVNAHEDFDIMMKSFGKDDDKILRVVGKYKYRPNGKPFDSKTLGNIEEAQRYLSSGVVCGGRNVLSHEEIPDLKTSGLFTEKNCLDMLSILSHLYERLDDAVQNI